MNIENSFFSKLIIKIYRFGNKNKNNSIKYFVWKILDTLVTKMIFNTEIPASVTIGENFTIYHPYGIIIHPDVIIGNNVIIRHQVTIGENHGGVPVLKNNIEIGAGAKIIGPVVLDDNIIIGANSVVTKSFSPNTVIAGIPAIKIKNLGE